MQIRALAAVTLIVLAACGDPDSAGSSLPPNMSTPATLDQIAPEATDQPGPSTPATIAPDPAPSSNSSVPGTTSAWLGTEPPSVTLAPGELPTSAPVTVAPVCVDATMQYAPSAPSDAWQRFVLEVAPTGACDFGVVLMMSLVIPGTPDAPGTLVTIVSQPADRVVAQPGTAIDIDGLPATMQQSVGADGRQATTIIAQFGAVIIDAHGFADEVTVRQIVASIAPVDDTAWAELVASVESG